MNEDARTLFYGTIGLIGGIALGAGIGLLIAPQSGTKTRQQVTEMLEDAADYAKETSQKLRQRWQD